MRRGRLSPFFPWVVLPGLFVAVQHLRPVWGVLHGSCSSSCARAPAGVLGLFALPCCTGFAFPVAGALLSPPFVSIFAPSGEGLGEGFPFSHVPVRRAILRRPLLWLWLCPFCWLGLFLLLLHRLLVVVCGALRWLR